jgi:hypothetical protein
MTLSKAIRPSALQKFVVSMMYELGLFLKDIGRPLPESYNMNKRMSCTCIRFFLEFLWVKFYMWLYLLLWRNDNAKDTPIKFRN